MRVCFKPILFIQMWSRYSQYIQTTFIEMKTVETYQHYHNGWNWIESYSFYILYSLDAIQIFEGDEGVDAPQLLKRELITPSIHSHSSHKSSQQLFFSQSSEFNVFINCRKNCEQQIIGYFIEFCFEIWSIYIYIYTKTQSKII